MSRRAVSSGRQTQHLPPENLPQKRGKTPETGGRPDYRREARNSVQPSPVSSPPAPMTLDFAIRRSVF